MSKKGKAIVVAIVVLVVLGAASQCAGGNRQATNDGARQASQAAESASSATAQAPVVVDKSVLQARHDTYAAMPRDVYEPDSMVALDAAVAAAESTLADVSATQDEVDAAAKAITTAAGGLEPIFDPGNYLDPGYEALARTPDDYVGQSVYVGGKVVQVIEEGGTTGYRVATDYAYDDVVLVVIDDDKLDGRLLEGDNVDCYGMYTGIQTYTSSVGVPISVPSISAEKVLLQTE